MTDDRRKQILEMIAKLSKITKESNAFQGEINNAAAKIQELMDKYSITSMEVDEVVAKGDDNEFKAAFESKFAEYQVKGIVKWHWDLAAIIARMTHTKSYCTSYGRRGTFVFFGEKVNTEVATQLFIEWVQVIEMMAISALDDYWKVVMKKYDYKGWLKSKKDKELHHGKWPGYQDKFMNTVPYEERTTYFKSSWLQGCVDGLSHAVSEQEDSRNKEVGSAIVLYTEKVDEAYALMKKGMRFRSAHVAGGRVGSGAGYQSGYKTGKGLNLTRKKIGD